MDAVSYHFFSLTWGRGAWYKVNKEKDNLSRLLRSNGAMTHPNHEEQIVFLKKIEGQLRGVQKMIEEKRYCVDILTQLHSIIGAVLRVESKILQKHLETCVTDVLKGSSETERNKKIEEVIDLITKFRKTT